LLTFNIYFPTNVLDRVSTSYMKLVATCQCTYLTCPTLQQWRHLFDVPADEASAFVSQ